MRSKELNSVFNRALTDPPYRQNLFQNLRRTLLEAGVPEEEVDLLEVHAPRSLEQLARILEDVHIDSFRRSR